MIRMRLLLGFQRVFRAFRYWDYQEGSYHLTIQSGFVGAEQDPDSHALNPSFVWAISHNETPE
ncbi:MAG: hypothetical protein E2O35_03120 [Proteobacteria bacterium]|nr:MAG: hypothetical protein E2O35_03120 [Pseudomonadota bacterium]